VRDGRGPPRFAGWIFSDDLLTAISGNDVAAEASAGCFEPDYRCLNIDEFKLKPEPTAGAGA
jgi:hypothetical protein